MRVLRSRNRAYCATSTTKNYPVVCMVDHKETLVCHWDECQRAKHLVLDEPSVRLAGAYFATGVALLREFDARDPPRSSKTVVISQVQYHDCVAPVSDRTTIVRILGD